jgi:hypothetical protein
VTSSPRLLARAAWEAAGADHARRADSLTAGRRARVARGDSHAVDDFLYTYYPTRPARLRRWHPGAGVVLAAEGRAPAPHAGWRWYRTTSSGDVSLDLGLFLSERDRAVRQVRGLLAAIRGRPAFTGCFGLHEWAMVYGSGSTRHDLPLRLGAGATDRFVESRDIRCSHFDAFRFFTAGARPRNATVLTREDQEEHEQPGCVHVSMDSHRYALKLGPLVPGPVALDCFELARDARSLDMRASPYDLRGYGEEPVRIETPDGRAEYARQQRALAERAGLLQEELLRIATAALAPAPGAPDGPPPA